MNTATFHQVYEDFGVRGGGGGIACKMRHKTCIEVNTLAFSQSSISLNECGAYGSMEHICRVKRCSKLVLFLHCTLREWWLALILIVWIVHEHADVDVGFFLTNKLLWKR